MKVMHKLLLLSVLPFLFIILSIIFVSKHQSESILRQQITESANLELNLHSERIEAFFLKKVDELRLMGSTPVVQRGNIPEILSYFEREQKHLSRHIEGIYYNDLEGTVYDVAGVTFSVRDRYYFPKIARGEVVITKVIKSRATQKPIVLILVPIFDTDGNRTGAVGGTILVKDLLQMIMDIKVGQSGFAVMVDEDDRVVSSFGKQRSPGKDIFLKPLDTTDSTKGLRNLTKTMRDLKHNTTRVVYDKSSYQAFFKPIKTIRWSLVLMYKDSEILATLKQMNTLYALMCFCIGIAICLFMYGTKRIVLDPIQTLVKVQQQFGEGDLSVRSKDTSPDEFGTLSLSFNNMADKLSERTKKIQKEVAERKQAEEILRESEQRFRAIFEKTAVGILIVDSKTRKYIKVNPAFQSMLGYNAEELSTMSPSDITHPEDRSSEEKLLEELISAKRDQYRIEKRYVRKDSRIVWCRVTVSMIYDGSSRPEFTISIVENINDLKQAEEGRRRLEAQLRQSHKMESIGTLAGGIAHDFNNILGIIVGNTELAIDDVPEWNPALFNLKEIKTASLRAKDVVRQLLSFARKTTLEKKPTNIIPIVKESLKLLRSSIPTSIEIRQNIQKDIDTILADPTQINQVLINLCTNADHAMQDGGIIEVTLKNEELDEDGAAKYPELNPGNYVNLIVSDTGHGISQKEINRIFDPYFTTKDVDKGTGMGLAVVHGIVKEHNGLIAVESELGMGTTFNIFFPVVEKEAVVETETDEKLPTGEERILFIDDEESIAKLGHRRLERLGYKVEATTSPIEALELFRSQPDKFDLTMTDLTMPQMTGDKLVKEILNIRPDIPVILCTGFSEKVDEKKAKAIGAADYIEKPLDKHDFAFKVRKVLDGKRE